MTRNIDLTIHGHTPLDAPLLLGNALFIDTGCFQGGPLTLLEAEEALDLLDGFGMEDAPKRAVC